MIPGPGCGIFPRSGMPPAPGPAAEDLHSKQTSSTMSRIRRAAGRASATLARSAGTITGSSSTRGGRWISFPVGRSGGPPPPGGPTTPSPPGIRSSRQGFNTNNRVIGWPNSASDPGTDWFQLPYAGNPALGVMFVYAPFGFIVSMCAADPGNVRVVLRECNGSNWQRWIAAPVGSTGFFTWRNRATNRILQSGAKGAQLVTVTQPATPAATRNGSSAIRSPRGCVSDRVYLPPGKRGVSTHDPHRQAGERRPSARSGRCVHVIAPEPEPDPLPARAGRSAHAHKVEHVRVALRVSVWPCR
jgi:hypothetical protein